jgi:hypothetical protein
MKEPLKVINPSRSERGWRGRRRIAVLVSLAGVLGIAALGSAGTASAATVANCNAKLKPKGAGTKAKLSFVCDGPVRAYSVGSNKPIKDYGNPSGGGASGFFTCEGTGVGFGCGIPNRATPGFQNPGTTGWGATFPPAPGATQTPTTCGGFKRIESSPPAPANRNGIVGPPCTQLIAPGTKVAQNLKLGSSPCAGGSRNPLQLYLFVGGEPPVTSFTVGGDSTTVGEYLQGPTKVNLKAYKKTCGKSGKSSGKGGGRKSSSPPTKFPVSCAGAVAPATTPAGADVTVRFSCNQNVRAFAVYSNKSITVPGDEPVVTGNNGGGLNESAVHQCEGDIPGPGYGCGIVDRQTQSANVPNGNTISAGNTAEQKMSFEFSPCQKPGEPKTKVWLIVMGEPVTGPYSQGSSGSVGEYSSAPQQLALTGYGKCKGGKKGGGKKK